MTDGAMKILKIPFVILVLLALPLILLWGLFHPDTYG